MTTSVKVSVNGNYKTAVSVKQGSREEKHLVSGRGLDTANDLYIPFHHGDEPMIVTVGPEEPDNGEPE